MLKPVKPRGDTSVAFLSTGLYIKEPANICHGIHRQAGVTTPGPQLLRAKLSSDVFNLFRWYSPCPCIGIG